jgi:hypothetical protein
VRRGPVGAAALAALLVAAPALAHEVGLSRADFAADGPAIRADVAFARRELASLVAGLDRDHDGALSAAEIEAGRDSLEGAVIGRIKVLGDGAPCAGKLLRAELAEQDGVVLHAAYRCARRPAQVTVTVALLDDLPFGHRSLVRAEAATGALDLVLSQRVPTFSFAPPPDARAGSAAPAPGPLAAAGRVAAHAWPLPVFLVGLLARAADRRAVLGAGAAFAAAVLVGLGASALGLFTPSPRAVAIAALLSLPYVGVDNLAGGAPRPLLALPFGVVHGLAAAVLLRALGAAPVPFAAALLGAVALLVAGIAPATRWVAKRRRGATALHLAVTAAGVAGLGALYWLPP